MSTNLKGAQKKTDAYKLMDSQKTREYEATGAQKKIDAYKLMDSQKTREYNLKGAQKTGEYVITGVPKSMCTDQESQRSVCEKQFMCRSAKE